MTRDIDAIVESHFDKNSLEDLSLTELQSLASTYSYSCLFQYLVAAKKKLENPNAFEDSITKLSVYTNHLNWLLYQLNEETILQPEQSGDLIPIEPYHTIDYFASQGIKLSPKEHNDLLGKRLKSFTSWLKTMKKIQPLATNDELDEREDYQSTSPSPVELAVTEAMADVYVKQGLYDKAIDILDKLSLQNPANSHIFVRKIQEIKAIRP